MKYLRLFENYQDIDAICKKYHIKNYTINNDGSIDVNGSVSLYGNKLETLPLKFGNVTGSFFCSYNQLTSLEGAPRTVGGNFDCSENKLVSLEGCPKSVGEGFYCNNNQLTSLNGCPANIKFIECERNPIYFWWKRIYYMKYLEIFLDMNIHSDDPYDVNSEKINIILEK